MAGGIPWKKLAGCIKDLDEVSKDGSSKGTLKMHGDFVEIGNGEWGFVGRAAIPAELAAVARLVPAELQGEVEKIKEWARATAVEIEWHFGPREEK